MNDCTFLVDDEVAVRTALTQTLELADISVESCNSAKTALAKLDLNWPGAIVTDMRMPDQTGADLLAAVQKMDPDIPVIILTGQGDIPMAVAAMAAGAYDFLEKPCSSERLVEIVKRACEKRRLVCENRHLKERLDLAEAGALSSNILGEAQSTRRYRDLLKRVAQTDLDVLILGETGAGKELAARAIHAQSDRHNGPFVAVNCGALPIEIAGSELFGHEKGAFTGAANLRVGKFEHANGGTILLDEIESMPLDLQVKLLRILQERELERIGANKSIPLNIRVIAATKSDLKEEAKSGRFREDLFFRLDVAHLSIPPVRDRKEDVPLLFKAFVDAAAGRRDVEAPDISTSDIAALIAYDWPGNVREIKNSAERFAMGLGLMLGESFSDQTIQSKLSARVDAFEKSAIEAALRGTGGSVTKACVLLEIPRKTLYDKMNRHHISADNFRT
jgi:two-component system, NtrC family, C4-dicarboxylate transport response regulator DctD